MIWAKIGICLGCFFAGWFLSKLDEHSAPQREGTKPSAPNHSTPPKPVRIPRAH
jgi:hypothetical protein